MLEIPVYPTIYLQRKRRIHNFPRGISTKWNENKYEIFLFTFSYSFSWTPTSNFAQVLSLIAWEVKLKPLADFPKSMAEFILKSNWKKLFLYLWFLKIY